MFGAVTSPMVIDSCILVAIQVKDFKSYLKKMREAFVIVDPVERKKKIEEEMIREGASVSGKSSQGRRTTR